jgi:hypothetical protein
MYALEKSKSIEISCRPTFLMWIDGVLDTDRLAKLSKEPNLGMIEQHDHFVIVSFSSCPRRQHYRYLDPHRFVVQMNLGCTELEINFNPSPDEVKRLREFYHRLEQVKIHNRKFGLQLFFT